MTTNLKPFRGDVVLLDPSVEERLGVPKSRPWLIVQNNMVREWEENTIACYITSAFSPNGKPRRERNSYARIKPRKPDLLKADPHGNGINVESFIACCELYTLRAGETLKRIGVLNEEEMLEVDAKLKVSLGLK